jgi:hypothetical protein
VKVTASRLADVAVGDPHPLEGCGLGQHRLQELAVMDLDVGALVQRQACLADPGREIVPHALQLAEAEHPRLGRRGRDRTVEIDSRERLGEEARQLALEPSDLASQLGAGKPLVPPDMERSKSLKFKQIRHTPVPSLNHRL